MPELLCLALLFYLLVLLVEAGKCRYYAMELTVS